jgi:hypothetical protein
MKPVLFEYQKWDKGTAKKKIMGKWKKKLEDTRTSHVPTSAELILKWQSYSKLSTDLAKSL